MSASINGIHFAVDPSSIRWDYTLKISTKPTIGGKVVQLYGYSLGNLVVSGSFGSVERQAEFVRQIDAIAAAQAPMVTQGGAVAAAPVRFSWPSQKWDFWVYIMAIGQEGASVSIETSEAMNSPKYTLTMFVYEDNGNVVSPMVDNAMTSYLHRITAGLGWTQSEYNGPLTVGDRNTILAGQTLFDYAFVQYGLLADPNVAAAASTTGGGTVS
jgi:hypothetical protein